MRLRVWWSAALIGALVGLIVAVLYQGDRTLTPDSRDTTTAERTAVGASPAIAQAWKTNGRQPLPRLIVQILLVIATSRMLAYAVHRLGQPAVIGEIAAGIVLGPSVLGAAAPRLFAGIFPADSLPTLQLLSQLGIILFMFVVGLELNWSHVRGRAQTVAAISLVSILFPFLLGLLVAIPLYGGHAPPGITFAAFGLFLGIGMSITAFPVLARILEELRLSKTPVGSMALTCAAVGDVGAWTLLAFVTAMVGAGGGLGALTATLTVALLLTLFLVFVVRPLLPRLLDADGRTTFHRARLGTVLLVLFGCAMLTEIIGVHALFGAFLAGAIMPESERLRDGLRQRLESFSTVFLLPLFFAHTGLRTDIGLLDDGDAWLICLGIIVLATVGKLGAGAVTARLMGLEWRNAFVLGALLNTRGLMELIALNVGYDLGVISRQMFTTLVLMALVTTILTTPLVRAALTRTSGGEANVT